MSNQHQGAHARNAALLLGKLHFKYSHSLGQHFLLNDAALSQIVARADVKTGDCVVEIGAGAGVLTAHLLDAGARVLAIELDGDLKDVFNEVTRDSPNAHLVHADAMKADISRLAAEYFGAGAKYAIVANLPYYITADFILRALTLKPKPARVTVMVQKEAAARVSSQAGQPNWCALAALVSYCARAQIVMDAPANLFTPPPHVDSQLLRLDVYTSDERPVKPKDEALLTRVINAAFMMRRKTLCNNLMSAFSLSRDEAHAVLANAGIDARARGEALTLNELCAVADALSARA